MCLAWNAFPLEITAMPLTCCLSAQTVPFHWWWTWPPHLNCNHHHHHHPISDLLISTFSFDIALSTHLLIYCVYWLLCLSHGTQVLWGKCSLLMDLIQTLRQCLTYSTCLPTRCQISALNESIFKTLSGSVPDLRLPKWNKGRSRQWGSKVMSKFLHTGSRVSSKTHIHSAL